MILFNTSKNSSNNKYCPQSTHTLITELTPSETTCASRNKKDKKYIYKKQTAKYILSKENKNFLRSIGLKLIV